MSKADAPAGKRALVWFRADLRTVDNAALLAASAESGGNVLGVFVICADQWREHDWAAVKVDFILRTLAELSRELEKLGIPLLIVRTARFEGVPAALLALAEEHGCGSLYFGDEYEVNELARDERVVSAFEASGRAVRRFTDQCVVTPGEVRTGEGRYFTVFSPFKRALYKRLDGEGGVRSRGRPAKQPPTGVAPSPVPASVPGFASSVPASTWPAGERHAEARLAAFVERSIRPYKERRDFPGIDGTSVLSPYLVVGAVSLRRCFEAAAEANAGKLDGGNEGISHWISELAWREFYKHILVGFPRVCRHRAFKPATERQLRATGWMHNRVRMITAMYLTKDLFLDWRLGERHFMRHLVDGDLAPNNGGWQWSASTGTDAAPYFRIFNPISQSRRFDPDGAYIKRYVPELAGLDGGEDGPVHDPAELPALLRRTVDYPAPIVDRAKTKGRVMAAFQGLGG
jgi:deoxyribodipyrimidine photo-lyase